MERMVPRISILAMFAVAAVATAFTQRPGHLRIPRPPRVGRAPPAGGYGVRCEHLEVVAEQKVAVASRGVAVADEQHRHKRLGLAHTVHDRLAARATPSSARLETLIELRLPLLGNALRELLGLR